MSLKKSRQSAIHQTLLFRSSNKSSFIRNCIALPTSLVVGASGIAFSPISTAAKTPTITVAQAGSFKPSWSDCEEVEMDMTNTLKLKDSPLNRDKGVSFNDPLTGGGGESCVLKATVARGNFQNIARVRGALKSMLTRYGWKENNKYAADGVDGTMIGFLKGKEPRIALLSIEIDSDSDVAPNKRGYVVTLKIAKPQIPG